jgi:hypothetical protein
MYLPWIRKGRNNFLTPKMPIGVLKMSNLNIFFLEIQISSFYQAVCFLCGMATIDCKLGYLISNVCIMKILNGITQWIPLCSTLHIALWSFSPPQQTSTSQFPTLQLCFEFSLYYLSIAFMFLITFIKFLPCSQVHGVWPCVAKICAKFFYIQSISNIPLEQF